MYAHRSMTDGVDGYILLAEAIIEAAASDYEVLYPAYANSESEFELQDQWIYAPQRNGILYGLAHSSVRSIIDYDVCFAAFESRRKQHMKKSGVKWI